MKIRSAEIRDSQAIVSIWERTNLTRPWNNPEDDIKRSFSNPNGTLLIGEIEGNIIGTVMAGYDGHRGWIYYLAVVPEYQGEGYGKQLMQDAEGWLKSRNAPKVHLLIRKENRNVQSFYHSIGYENSDVIMMQKTL